jgi:acetyl-CoA carboxylase biotin carboxyl carrier protein
MEGKIVMLDYEQIKELINSIDSSSLRVFQLESEGIKLKLSKNQESFNERPIESISEVKIPQVKSNVVNSEKETKEEKVVTTKENNLKDENLNIVKSPLVGTYYSSSTPGGKPYAEVGSKVKKGDVLCIVEAMKIMNEITSEYDGEVVEALRQDEDIVEFGMDLFKIK